MFLKKLNKDDNLSLNNYGLYKVLHENGSMPYKLELHSSLGVHLISHVSYLNKVIGDMIPIKIILK